MRTCSAFGAALALLPTCVCAIELPLPDTATLSSEQVEPFAGVSLPVGPWRNGAVETVDAEGAVTRQAWDLPNSSLTTLQILAPLRDAMIQDSFAILYECADQACGGFDFRYHLDLLPEPAMHVDLGNYRYVLARRETPKSPEFVSVVASRSMVMGFAHITHIADPAEAPTITRPATEAPESQLASPPPKSGGDSSFTDQLTTEGRAVLDGLRFATGSSALEQTLFSSLVVLADWLKARPAARVILVGHSDNVGGLETNVTLSRDRAQSVADRLISGHGVPGGQVSAEGVGYLAPRASNATEEGRAANRRVEVVVTDPG